MHSAPRAETNRTDVANLATLLASTAGDLRELCGRVPNEAAARHLHAARGSILHAEASLRSALGGQLD